MYFSGGGYEDRTRDLQTASVEFHAPYEGQPRPARALLGYETPVRARIRRHTVSAFVLTFRVAECVFCPWSDGQRKTAPKGGFIRFFRTSLRYACAFIGTMFRDFTPRPNAAACLWDFKWDMRT